MVPECWHGDVCPWHKRGRCLFKALRASSSRAHRRRKCLSSSSCGTCAVLSRDWLRRSCGETACSWSPSGNMVFHDCEDTTAKDTLQERKEYTSYYRKLATETIQITARRTTRALRTSMRQTTSTTSTMTRT